MPEISCARYRIRRTHLTKAKVCSRTFTRAVFYMYSPPTLSLCLSLLPPEIPISSSRPLVSRSLRYPRTLRSRTHVVVRMHTRAYVRRVLRKLAPYASIQISHLSHVCVPTPSDLPMRGESFSYSFLFLSLTLSSFPV